MLNPQWFSLVRWLTVKTQRFLFAYNLSTFLISLSTASSSHHLYCNCNFTLQLLWITLACIIWYLWCLLSADLPTKILICWVGKLLLSRKECLRGANFASDQFASEYFHMKMIFASLHNPNITWPWTTSRPCLTSLIGLSSNIPKNEDFGDYLI